MPDLTPDNAGPDRVTDQIAVVETARPDNHKLIILSYFLKIFLVHCT